MRLLVSEKVFENWFPFSPGSCRFNVGNSSLQIATLRGGISNFHPLSHRQMGPVDAVFRVLII